MENHEREMAYQLAFNKGLTAKALVSKDGHFIVCNESFCKLVEYSELELQRKTFQEITDPTDVKNDEDEARRVADGKIESYEIIKSYITKTKRIIKVKLRVDGLRDSTGTFICFIAQAVEITPNVNTEIAQPIIIDIRTAKALAWLQKNGKTILTILTGLSMLGFYLYDKLNLVIEKFFK